MKREQTGISKLPDHLIRMIGDYSERLNISKEKVIENAILKYFEEIERNEFAESFKRLSSDSDLIDLAEEGLADYNKMLIEYETKGNMVSEPRTHYGKRTKRNPDSRNSKRVMP